MKLNSSNTTSSPKFKNSGDNVTGGFGSHKAGRS